MDNKPKLRINFILPPSNLSGGPLAIMEYANRLLKKGHDVSITTYPTTFWPEKWEKNKSPFPWFKFEGKYFYHTASVLERLSAKIAVKSYLGLGGNADDKRSMGLESFYWDWTVISYLIGCIPECDINIATMWSTAYAAFLSKKGKAVYFMQHYEEVFYPIDDSMVLNRLGARMSYQLPIYKIANSSWLQNMILEKCGQLVPFSNNALDLNDFQPMVKHSENDGIIRILTFSRPEEWKGFADTAAAMAQIHFEYGDRVEWHVFGQEHEFIKPNSPDAPYVLHIGLPFSELAKLYAQSDIVVCGSWYESFPLPPIEAMASGTAVVTTLNGMEDYCFDEKNCLAVKTRDIESFVTAIRRLIEDANLRARLAKAGLDTASNYDWDTAVNRREQMLYDIFEGRVDYNIAKPLHIGLTDDVCVPYEQMPTDIQKSLENQRLISFCGLVFLLDDGCKRHIATPEILGRIMRANEEIEELDPITFSRIPRGLPIKTLNDVKTECVDYAAKNRKRRSL